MVIQSQYNFVTQYVFDKYTLYIMRVKEQSPLRLITLNNYIKRFTFKRDISYTVGSVPSKRSFVKNACVRMSNGNVVELNKYIKEKYADRDKIQRQHAIDILYDIVSHKQELLKNFYNKSLSVQDNNLPHHIAELQPMNLNALSNAKEPRFKNFIRNLHYLGILKETTTNLKGIRSYLDVLDELFQYWIIDYKLLTPSALYYFSNGIVGSILSSFYFRASIMNPYLAYSVIHHLSPSVGIRRSVFDAGVRRTRRWRSPTTSKNFNLFTPVLGWSSYFAGAAQLPGLRKYTGIDVLPKVCEKTRRYAARYPTIDSTIICKKSELVAQDKQFLRENREKFDVIFFSPPYYKLEEYSDVMREYPDFQSWIDTYWIPTIQMCHHVMRPNGRMGFIVSLDKENDIRKMIQLSRVGFHRVSTYPILNVGSDVNKTYKTEHLYIYRKK